MKSEKGGVLVYSRVIIAITFVALFLFTSADAHCAEAFHNGVRPNNLLITLPYHADKAFIKTAETPYLHDPSQADNLNAMSGDLEARFANAIEEARLTAPPENAIDIGAQFTQDFAAANDFHLIPRNPSADILTDSITISRGDASAFLSLPQAGERLLASHFIQPLFGTDYVVWPGQQLAPLDTLSHRRPLQALVRYGTERQPRPFTGQIILSFDSLDGQISLSAAQEAFDLFFKLDNWHDGAPLHLEALLRHGTDDYAASLFLAYTNLPHSAIWGYFRNHQTLATTPLDGHFTNFTLPED